MAKEKNKELIDHMVDKMKAHELPYSEGAWEKFASHDVSLVSKKQTNWKYWSAAAAVLLFASASFLYLNQSAVNHGAIVANLPVETKLDTDKLTVETNTVETNKDDTPILKLDHSPKQLIDASSDQRSIVKNKIEHAIASIDHLLEATTQIFTDNDVKQEPVDMTSKSGNELVEVKKQEVKNNNLAQNTNTVRKEGEGNSSIAQKLEKLGSIFNLNSDKHDFASAIKKWEVGAFVAPSSTVDKMSMGGGLSLAYQITDKISIRSGVSMQQYGAGVDRQNNLGAVQSAGMAFNDAVSNSPVMKNNESLLLARQTVDKELSAVNNKLLTIDIPVDVRYHVSKSFYTSVGVSYVGVLDQTQENYFVNGINENTSANNGQAVSSPENVKQTFKGSAVNTNDFNGFVNLSIGKKMTVGKKLSIAVEPFVKLPVGGLKSTDFNYTNGGLKVVTSF